MVMNDVVSKSAFRRPAVCVFCGSNFGKDPLYSDIAERMGRLIGVHGCDLVFGGGGVGLMGVTARAAAAAGARVLGVIPGFLQHLEPPSKVSSELVVTETMFERKARMFAECDAFVVLPGGLGTLDELSEAITYAQLHLHAKPVVFVNVNGYFDKLFGFLQHIVDEDFAKPSIMDLIRVVESPEAAMPHLLPEAVPVAAK